MPIMRVSDPTYDERKSGNRVFVRFRVNRQPDQSWIETFKVSSSARTSVSVAGEARREARKRLPAGSEPDSGASKDQVARQCLRADARRHYPGGRSET